MAAPLLSLTQARLAFADRPLFDGLDLKLEAGARVALVGRNGAGKSTLLKVLAAQLELDGGERTLGPRVRTAYLAQAPIFRAGATANDWITRVDSEAPEGVEPHVAQTFLDALELDGEAAVETLSGGQQRRLALARALAIDADVLMLDEPTNHLDIQTILWLQERLGRHPGAVVLVSHDRAFLNALARRCWWLDRGGLLDLDVPFADLDEAIASKLEAAARETRKLDRLIAEETRWSREGITARRKRNQGRLRRLASLRRERAARRPVQGTAKLEAGAAPASGTLVVEAADISKAYGERTVVAAFSTRILRGDRVGLVGRNGAGKSTLLGLLTGRLAPDGGTVKLGTNLQIAWFEQDRSSLDLARTPWQVLCPDGGDRVDVQGRNRHVVGYLKDFLFDESQIRAPCRALSGGERNRLLLARILARPSNLLVLDEPTNDLDVETLDVLTDALADYGGTLLVVSHDRDFLDRTVTSTIAFEPDGTVTEYAGGYSDMLAQRATPQPEASARPRGAAAARRGFSTPGKEQRKREREVEKALREVERLHGAIAALEAELADGSLFVRRPAEAGAKARELEALRTHETAAEERWLELATALEAER